MSDLGRSSKRETGRGLVQAGVNVANIPAPVADAAVTKRGGLGWQ